MMIIEEILPWLISLVMITQVFIPIAINRPIFFLFRRSIKNNDLDKARQRIVDAEKELELAQLEATEQALLEKTHQTRHPNVKPTEKTDDDVTIN